MLTNKHLLGIRDVCIYEKAVLFDKWVGELYPLKVSYKKDGNNIYKEIVKTLLNALYGKFGQTEPIEVSQENIDETGYSRMVGISLVTGERVIETQLMNTRIINSGVKSSDKAFVSIPAHVTEYARMLLWKIIKQVGVERVLYVDTDSIKIKRSDLWRIDYPINGTDLGALEIESKFDSGVIYGAKDYRVGDKVVLKGIPRKAVLHEDGFYYYTLFPGQATHLRLQVRDHYIMYHTRKHLSRVYSKGIVTSSGRVTPIELQEPPAFVKRE